MANEEQDPKTYFAAERTFLAWIRTGLALMGIGFAVARFGFFLRQLRVPAPAVTQHTTGASVWSGVALVLLGVVVNVSAVVEHFRVVKGLKTGNWVAGKVSSHGVALALLLAAAGLAMGGYLVFVR